MPTEFTSKRRTKTDSKHEPERDSHPSTKGAPAGLPLFMQRSAEAATMDPVVQRQPEEEEEELQLKANPAVLQRQPEEEEEELQLKANPAVLQRQEEEEEEELLQARFTTGETPTQFSSGPTKAENRTGMPVPLKAGLETLSGVDLSGVRVHSDSPKPAQLNALAYTQGQDIHVGPGQEKHLPHEGWHVVQQAQGRVKPTIQTKGVSINDDSSLEREADVMGAKALHTTQARSLATSPPRQVGTRHSRPVVHSQPKRPLGSSATVQRVPDEVVAPELSSLESKFEHEHLAIRSAVGALLLGKLAAGTVLYSHKRWTAVGLSENAFYAGPLTSDMGNFYYVYRFIGTDLKKGPYRVARGPYLHGWSKPESGSDLRVELAKAKVGEMLRFETKALTPSLSDEGATKEKTDDTAGGAPSKATSESETAVLTPHRLRWLKAGRDDMKNEIVSLFSSMEKLKGKRITAWEKNTEIKDPKPLRTALEVAVGVLGYGFGGAIGGRLTRGLAHGIVSDFIEESAVKATDKIVTAVFKNAIAPAKDFLSAATKKTLEEKTVPNVTNALASEGSLIDCYVESARLLAHSEERVQTREFNATADAQYSDNALADLVLTFQKLHTGLMADPAAFQRELTIAFVRLQDEVYLEERAKEYGDDRSRLLGEDATIHETETRKGNIRLVGPLGGIGKWGSPNFNVTLRGQATGINNATLGTLAGAPVKDLPVTLAFRFWASNPNPGWLFGDVFCKVWFTKQPNGSIWVDFDESGLGTTVDNGLEWLARYHLQSDRKLSEAECKKHAPEGAAKVYEHIKERPVIRVSNIDLF